MDYQPLGATGLTASVIGLGAGGPSQLGVRAGITATESRRIVTTALDHGINFIDTAEAYATEALIGEALEGSGVPRHELIVSTKVSRWEDLDACIAEKVAPALPMYNELLRRIFDPARDTVRIALSSS